MKEWASKDIKALRARFNLTQTALGEILGVSRVYVGLLEREEKRPGNVLRRLLNYVEKDLARTTNAKCKGKRRG